tara:strand:+ start:320 stop:511 length:192 start_codon:yes stop_codon:yes gene_type:complete
MKKSTRISLVVLVLWLCYIARFQLWEVMDEGVSHQSQLAMIIGLIVIWVLKVVLGYMVDDKEN